MTNIFENAYFGKAYKTRDGRKVIFHMATGIGASLLSEKYGLQLYHFDGVSFMKISESDIVSEWQEEINEEELDRLAMIKYPCDCSPNETYCDCCINPDLKEAFKTGYRKALNK